MIEEWFFYWGSLDFWHIYGGCCGLSGNVVVDVVWIVFRMCLQDVQ